MTLFRRATLPGLLPFLLPALLTGGGVLLPVAYSFIGGSGPVHDEEEVPQAELENPDEGDDEWLPENLKIGAGRHA